MIEFLVGVCIGNLLSGKKRSSHHTSYRPLPYWAEKHLIEQAKSSQRMQEYLQGRMQLAQAEQAANQPQAGA